MKNSSVLGVPFNRLAKKIKKDSPEHEDLKFIMEYAIQLENNFNLLRKYVDRLNKEYEDWEDDLK